MGHSIFSVSIVQFIRGKLRVLSETSDRVGGRDMAECMMREFAAQFQKKARRELARWARWLGDVWGKGGWLMVVEYSGGDPTGTPPEHVVEDVLRPNIWGTILAV